MKEQKIFLPNIGICIFMDLFGMIPTVFPWAAAVVAPISGLVFFNLFGGRIGIIGGVLDFLEEIVPIVDFIPTYTIAWFIRKNQINRLNNRQLDI